jgi:hypothetical protein
MKKTSFMFLMVVGGLVACDESTGIPATPEPLAVSLQTRSWTQGEPVRLVSITGGVAAVTMKVTRPGFCATRVEAGLSREPGDLTVVAHVSYNPAAICPAVITVLDYTGTISNLMAGSYRVRVFEEESGTTHLLGSAVVSVSSSAIISL